MIDTFQEIYGELKRNILRTTATGFAVTSGLFLLIVLLGAGNGVINSFTVNIGQFAFDAIHVFGGRTTMPYEGIKEGRRIQLDTRDVEMTKKNFSEYVNSVVPTITRDGMNASFSGNYIPSVKLVGIYPSYASSQAIQMLQGRFINDIDLQQSRKTIVIGGNNCDDLFKNNENPIGQSVNISGIIYTVVGVYKTNEMSNSSDFYVPYSTLSTIYNRGKFIDEITMNTHNIPTQAAMDSFVTDYIRASSAIHSFDPRDERALWIWNQAGDNIKMQAGMEMLHTAFWVLGLLTLISGIVGVSNIMLISVKERTREFGIRRAIGARPWSIIRMVILESIIITAIFGYIGMVLGVFFCEWMDYSVGNKTMDLGVFQAKYFIDPTVDLGVCIRATIVIIIAGALAGFFPARKAVKVKPIDALRG